MNSNPLFPIFLKANQLKYNISNAKIKKMKLIKKFSDYIDQIDATLRFCNKFINEK